MTAKAFQPGYVIYSPLVKNNVIDGASFARIMYSTPVYTTHGIALVQTSGDVFRGIEKVLLQQLNPKKDIVCTVLPTKGLEGYCIKISGVWETGTTMGLALKLIHL